MSGPILSSALNQIYKDLALLPADAKAAVVLEGRTETESIGIGAAARIGKGWVLSAEAEWRLRQKPSARFGLGKVWK
jgi:hypothetical protein